MSWDKFISLQKGKRERERRKQIKAWQIWQRRIERRNKIEIEVSESAMANSRMAQKTGLLSSIRKSVFRFHWCWLFRRQLINISPASKSEVNWDWSEPGQSLLRSSDDRIANKSDHQSHNAMCFTGYSGLPQFRPIGKRKVGLLLSYIHKKRCFLWKRKDITMFKTRKCRRSEEIICLLQSRLEK